MFLHERIWLRIFICGKAWRQTKILLVNKRNSFWTTIVMSSIAFVTEISLFLFYKHRTCIHTKKMRNEKRTKRGCDFLVIFNRKNVNFSSPLAFISFSYFFKNESVIRQKGFLASFIEEELSRLTCISVNHFLLNYDVR